MSATPLTECQASIIGKDENFYKIELLNDGAIISVPLHTMQRCVFPAEMIDDDYTLKVGIEITLMKKICVDGKVRYYPAHQIYKPRRIYSVLNDDKSTTHIAIDKYVGIEKISTSSTQVLCDLIDEFRSKMAEFDADTCNTTLSIIAGKKLTPAAICSYLRKLLHKPAFAMESETVEYKSSFYYPASNAAGQENDHLSQVRKIVKTLASFANSETHHGTLIVGVKDGGEVCGVENEFKLFNGFDRDKFTAAFMNLYRQTTTATLMYQTTLTWLDIDGHLCARFVVDYGGDVVLINGTELYVRKNSSTYQLKGPDMVEFIRNYRKRDDDDIINETTQPKQH